MAGGMADGGSACDGAKRLERHIASLPSGAPATRGISRGGPQTEEAGQPEGWDAAAGDSSTRLHPHP